jgi:hypothetical protein
MDAPFTPPDGIDSECQRAEDDSVISDDPGFDLERLDGDVFSDLEAFSNTTQDVDGAPSGLDIMLFDLDNDFSDLSNRSWGSGRRKSAAKYKQF